MEPKQRWPLAWLSSALLKPPLETPKCVEEFCRRCCFKPHTTEESGGIGPLFCMFLSCYNYCNCYVQSTCT
ncbi:hypothetical protein AV530_014281 [Patagioenas fasciata monilis]|uniref:Uncharacterized protein n=1 Tax=Patagioenas fasciata monilis TaxID=372326 RepID=A0A1V4KBE4_PATFA|nr:hypothetical protein AV530_014281 [Patagioenas fasciata monilis]